MLPERDGYLPLYESSRYAVKGRSDLLLLDNMALLLNPPAFFKITLVIKNKYKILRPFQY